MAWKELSNFCNDYLLTSILETISDGIAILNSEGTIIKHNSSFVKLLDMKQTTVEGEDFYNIIAKSGTIDKDVLSLTSEMSSNQLVVQKRKILTPDITLEVVFLKQITPDPHKDYEEIKKLRN